MSQRLLLVIFALIAYSLAATLDPGTASKAESLESELVKKLKDNNEDYSDTEKQKKLEERGQPGNESRRVYGLNVHWGDSAPDDDVDSSSDTFNAIPRTPSMKATRPHGSRGKDDNLGNPRDLPQKGVNGIEKQMHKIQKLKRLVEQKQNLLGGMVDMQRLKELIASMDPAPPVTPQTSLITENPPSPTPLDPGLLQATKDLIQQQISNLLGFNLNSDTKQKLRELFHSQDDSTHHADPGRPPQAQRELAQHNKNEDIVLGALLKSDKAEVPHVTEATLQRSNDRDDLQDLKDLQRLAQKAIPPLHSKYGLQEIKETKRNSVVNKPRLMIVDDSPSPLVQRAKDYEDNLLRFTKGERNAINAYQIDRILDEQGWYFGKRGGRSYDKKLKRVGRREEHDSSFRTTGTRDPRDLDLAPAVGGRVNNLRAKGRICQRNVLIPEGPKYDSKGKVYLQAFRPQKGSRMDYARTYKPDFVLPKCCNCCKKSVLGCV